MTEENGVNCATSIEPDDKEDAKTAQELKEDSNETIANPSTSKTDGAISIEATENVNGAIPKEKSKKDEKRKGVKDQKARISWAVEGEQFKVKWSLPEGVASSEDFIALCRGGKC